MQLSLRKGYYRRARSISKKVDSSRLCDSIVRIIRRHSSKTALAVSVDRARLHFASLVPGPTRSRCYLANARGGGGGGGGEGGGGGGDTRRGEKGGKGAGGGGGEKTFMENISPLLGMYYGERTWHSERTTSNSLTSRSRRGRVVGARRSVFPRNKQTWCYDTELNKRERYNTRGPRSRDARSPEESSDEFRSAIKTEIDRRPIPYYFIINLSVYLIN